MQSFDFGNLDELTNSDGRQTVARWIAYGLGAVFFTLSAMTTGAFFMFYAPGLGDLAGPVAAPYVSAAIGIICLDLAALLWSFVRSHGSDSRSQMLLAGIVGAVDLVMSLATSALYVVLSGSNLSAGVYDAAGRLTGFGQSLHLAGVLIITLALVLNFGAVWLFGFMSAGTRAAAQRSELAAMQREASYAIRASHTREAVKRSIVAIGAELPAVTQAAADANRAAYVASMTPSAGRSNAVENSHALEPIAHANGAGPRP